MGRGTKRLAGAKSADSSARSPRALLAAAVAAVTMLGGWLLAGPALASAASAAESSPRAPGVITLQEALERALTHHPTVLEAAQNVLQTEFALERDEARRRPTASISAAVAGMEWRTGEASGPTSWTVLDENRPITLTGNWQLAAGTSVSATVREEPVGQPGTVLSLSLNQQLVPSPRHSESERSRLSTLEAAEEAKIRFARAQASALIDVFRRYRSLQVEEARIGLLEQQAALAEENYAEAVRRFESGLASEIDVLNAAIERDRAQATLERSQRELALTKAAFARDLGLAEGSLVLEPLPEELLWTPVQVELDAAVERALAVSADYLAAQRNLRSAERTYEAVMADSGLGASVTVTLRLPEWQGASPEFSAMLTASYDLADGGSRALARREAEAALERARRAVETAEAALRSDIARRLSELEWLAAQVDFAERAWELAERTYEIRTEQAARGLVAERTVSESRRQAEEAKLSYIQAIVAYEAARLELEAMMGEQIEIEGVRTRNASSGGAPGYPSP